MPTFYTLATREVEKSLQDWGVTLDFEVFRQSKGANTATLRTVENFDPVAANWFFKQKATIYRDRVGPAGGPYGGGAIIFQGYFDDPKMEATPHQHIVYELKSVWWLFERSQFKQYTMQFTGFSKTNKRVISATVSNPGRNYKSGDTGTVSGGVGTLATYKVVAVGANGAVILVTLTNGGGNYTQAPASPAGTQASSGIGAGLTLSITTGPFPNLVAKVSSEIFLGEDLHQADGFTELWPNGNGGQVGEVVDWINETYNPTKQGAQAGRNDALDVVQKGTIDPHTMMPVTRVNTYFCDEAIRACLRWDPDTVIVEDPTTTPPTLHFRKLARWDYTTNPPTFKDYANLPAVAVPITAQRERQLVVQGQLSRRVPGVIIIYKSLNVVDGATVASFVADVFPPGVTDWTPEVSTHLIELEGSKLVHLQALVKVNEVFPLSLLASGDPASQAQWWLGHDRSLSDPAIDPATIAVKSQATVVDDQGNAIDVVNAFTQELASALPTWTGQVSVRAHVSQQISFTRKAKAGSVVNETRQATRVHTKTIVVTTAQGQLYTALGSFTQAEAIPQNVAESVFRSLAFPQYQGTISFDDFPLRSDVQLGTRLVLKGPNLTFGDPDDKVNPSVILVQSVRQRPAYGQTEVTFGAGPAVDLDAWIELARASRGRLTWNLPSNRGDGGSNPSGSSVSVDTGADAPSDDTSHGVGGLSFLSVIGSPL